MPSGKGVLDEHSRREVINGLAAVLASEGSAVRQERLPQMYVRALRAVRGAGAVSAVLRADERLGASRQDLDFLDNCSDALREMIAMGWLRPIVGPMRARGQNWMLDIGPIAAGADASFELALFDRIRKTLQIVVEIWDSSNGQGVFALHRISALARKTGGRAFSVASERTLIRELRSYADKYFQLQMNKRLWSETPRVVVRRIDQ